MQVPFFRYNALFERDRELIQAAIAGVCERGAYILQAELADFEERLAEFCGVRHAIGVANATDALELILTALGFGPGDEILVPSHTFVATVSPIVAVGATPVFVEIGRDHLLDPEDAERRITPRTRAIMPTQLNGRTADMEAINSIATAHGLAILEDSAQGLGSRFGGRMAGTFAAAGIYSFYPAKTLGCLGDGGAIVTDDGELADRLREMRDHGRSARTGEIVRWGRNSRLDNLQAAILLGKLAKIDDEIEHRRKLAETYDAILRDVPGLVLPPPPDNDPSPMHFDVYQNYEIEADERDGLRQFLLDRGIGTILQWGGKAVHEFPALGLNTTLPKTESVMRRSMLLPLNSSVTVADARYVAGEVSSFYATRVTSV